MTFRSHISAPRWISRRHIPLAVVALMLGSLGAAAGSANAATAAAHPGTTQARPGGAVGGFQPGGLIGGAHRLLRRGTRHQERHEHQLVRLRGERLGRCLQQCVVQLDRAHRHL